MNIRKYIFFLLDSLLNSKKITKHLEDIKSHYYNYSADENIKLRENRLSLLLRHATETVPFYQGISFDNLSNFPIVNKTIIKENYANFYSNIYNQKDLSFVTTSGSTGTPFKSYRDKQKIHRHNADNIFFNSLAGADIGMKLYYFRVWNSINRKGAIKKFLQNIEEIDASNFTNQYIQSLLKRIQNDPSSKYMLSYASSYEALCQPIIRNNFTIVDPKVDCMISMSENLPENARQFLENYFNTIIVSRYSNMENGFIGQQCLSHKHEYHINTASFMVELLSLESDIPAQQGKIGRIVVTDYFNFGMPIIRYDTGDLGILSESLCSVKGPVLTKVEGRKTDFIYSTSGQMLSPHIITNTMWKYTDIYQFQFIQKSKTYYILKLNSEKELDISDLNTEFISFLGHDAVLEVQYVSEIPLLASGKRRKVVQEYYK